MDNRLTNTFENSNGFQIYLNRNDGASIMRMLSRLFSLVLLLAISVTMTTAAEDVSVISDSTLIDIPLAQVQNGALPAYPISNDRGILIGGIGSDLYHMPGSDESEFWAVTDRGPNGEVVVNGETRATALVPEFTPTIMKVSVRDGLVTPVQYIPITTQSGKPVTGLPNISGYDLQFWDGTATNKIDYNPNGLDVEGLVRVRNGDFWIVDEYSPSLVHINAKGNVIARYVPEGVNLVGADYPVITALPAAYAKRKGNRGFEGMSISQDEKTIFIVLQSPLSAPDKDTGDRSRTTRIIKFDVPSARVTGEYAYRQEISTLFNPRPKMKQTEMKLSGVAAIDGDTLLVLERTDWAFAIYRVDLTVATNIASSVWSTSNDPVSLEFFAETSDVQVVPVSKELLVHSSSLVNMPEKVEGVTIVNSTTIAIANDNDFDVGSVDANGNNVGKNKKCRIIVLNVPALNR
jgi:hypothetical protein